MAHRLAFLALAAFWVTMNVWLWHDQYGGNDSDDFDVPPELVWHKILTAPDASSLSVYSANERMGYCEFSTGVGQQMATLDEDRPPPAGLVARAGYQIHFSGNVALGGFTNRLKFDTRVTFRTTREWSELSLRLTTRSGMAEIHSLATNQSVRVRFNSDGMVYQHDLPFAELTNPSTLMRLLFGNWADFLPGDFDLPELAAVRNAAPAWQWTARRTRLLIGSEKVPIYRLQTSLLGRTLTLDVSTLGDVLQLRLPGEFEARIDELNRP
jgi:hypothetical protein